MVVRWVRWLEHRLVLWLLDAVLRVDPKMMVAANLDLRAMSASPLHPVRDANLIVVRCQIHVEPPMLGDTAGGL